MRVFLILMLAMLSVCSAQSKLPAEMPEDAAMTYISKGGMVPTFFQASISGSTMTVTERPPVPGGKEITWTTTLRPDEKAALYRTFVENSFDTIKPNEMIEVADGRSRSIELGFGQNRFFAINGDGIRPPEGHAERFRKVEDAWSRVIADHEQNEPAGK